jgi:hypothetical protein
MKILPEYLIVSIIVTFILLYCLNPEPKIIIKMPNPSEPVSVLYVDDNNITYRYERKEIKI